MKRFLLLFTTCWVLIFVSACKKKEKDTPFTEDNPVFYCSCKFDGTPYNFQGGVNNCYMYSSYTQDSIGYGIGMYTFKGELTSVNCNNCKSISFQINDHKFSSTGGISGIDSLLPGKKNYASDSIWVPNMIQFYAGFLSISTPMSYMWNFGDGTTSSLRDPIHYYSVPGIYNVCLTISYSNKCVSSICNEIKATSISDCRASILTAGASGDTMYFDSKVNANIISYYWDFGDTASAAANTSSLKNPSHIFSSSGVYKVYLETVTVDHCVARNFKNISSAKNAFNCVTEMGYSYMKAPATSHFSDITITYRDNNNRIYTSTRTTQPADSYFEILSIEEYVPNENNQKTKKIKARFKCNVSDGTRIISLTDGDATIAVAYP